MSRLYRGTPNGYETTHERLTPLRFDLDKRGRRHIEPLLFGQYGKVLVAKIPHKLAWHLLLDVVEGEAALLHDPL